MKKSCFLICFLTVLFMKDLGADTRLTNYVNPNIGATHSRWFFYTPGSMPFGMAKPGPSTNGSYGNEQGWEAVGYEDGHTSIEGFPLFREFQIGGLMLQPVTGKLKTQPGTLENPEGGYRSKFEKEMEYATAGYYSVLLSDYDITAELTATNRVGFQRYTFPESSEARILFDVGNQLGESGVVIDSYIHLIDKQTLEGYIVTEPEYVKRYQAGGQVKMFFYAITDKPAKSVNTFFRGGEPLNQTTIQGRGAGISLNYDTQKDEQITVKIGLSYNSIEHAKNNLAFEAKNLSFDEAKAQSQDAWNDYLGRIKVEGGEKEARIKFYTGLYHALSGRGLASDVCGAYPMNNGEIGQIELTPDGMPKHHHYNTDAIWGAFWNLTQLWTIAYPDYFSEWIQSQLLVYKETGWLGDGIAASKYVSGVGTNFVSLAISAAYNCGIRDFDVELGYEAVLKNEIEWRDRIEGAGKMDVKQFVKRGYVPYLEEPDFWQTTEEGSPFGASHTLEYAFSSFAVGQFAKHLGKTDDYQMLSKHSKNWLLLFDDSLKLIRPRDKNGEFIKNFNPLEPWRGFQEGNAMQYTYYVPHDIEELVKRMGRKDFNNRLDSLFHVSQENIFGGGTELDAFSGVQAVYNHGNQPSLHISWLFNFSGKPSLSQKWARSISNQFYGLDGEHGYGYGQDEDQGQLGGWYVMSSIGLFDVKALTEINPTFQIGSPLYDKITIQLHQDYYSGEEFVIETKQNSPENKYIQSIWLNNQNHHSVLLPFEKVVNGGTLTIELGEPPNDTLD